MISRKFKVMGSTRKIDRCPMEQVGLIINFKNELFEAAMNGDRVAAVEAYAELGAAIIGLTDILTN